MILYNSLITKCVFIYSNIFLEQFLIFIVHLPCVYPSVQLLVAV